MPSKTMTYIESDLVHHPGEFLAEEIEARTYRKRRLLNSWAALCR